MEKSHLKRLKSNMGKLSRRKTIPEKIVEAPKPIVIISEFDIPGISKVALSPLTQIAIGAVIGEDVTSEQPWIYLKKEILTENLELHEESSEFLPIKKKVLQYTDTKLLLGYEPSLTDLDMKDKGDIFYVCTTIEAKDKVLNILAKREELIQERLKQSVEKTPGVWATLGSETEIDNNMIRDLRPQIEVEVVSKYPLSDKKVKFSMRSVEAARDGYTELLPSRVEYENVYRLRVDAAVQAAPKTITNEAQTNPTYPVKNWTQYQFDYKQPVLKAAQYKTIAAFIQKRMDQLSDTIIVNEEINLHTNDYEKLVKQKRLPLLTTYNEVLSFQDVISCKGKKVSSVSWHPTISGLIAVSYCNKTLSTIINEPPNLDLPFTQIYDHNLVLVWCYVDSLIPKLYLHSEREVNCVRFCANDGNILVGGCANGQIVVWDLTNKIAEVEQKITMSTTEQQNKFIIKSLMNWLKDTRDITVVHPTIVSVIDYSQTSWIMNILWVSADAQVTLNGKVEELDPTDERSCQFISSSMDGSVCIWDLKKIPLGQIGPMRVIKKSARVPERPSALTVEMSKLKVLDKMLIPIYKVKLEDSKGPIPISCIHMKMPRYEFSALNPETAEDLFQRTYFSVGGIKDNFKFEPIFTATSSTGNIYHFEFEGYDYNVGQRVNSGAVRPTLFQTIHDGPIKSVHMSPFFDNIILTIGGRVFAIWDKNNPAEPYFWRKSRVRYVFGMWSSNLPSMFFIGRIDFRFEVWDLTRRSRKPLQVEHLTGNTFLDGYTDATKVHSRKNTVCIMDAVGSVKVYRLPAYFATPDMNQINVIKKVLSLLDKRRKTLKQWQMEWMNRNIPAEPIVEEDVIQAPKKQESPDPEEQSLKKQVKIVKGLFTLDKIMQEKWNEKEEQFMYNVLLKKKKINLAEIELHKEPLEQLAESTRQRRAKEVEMLARKDSIFKSAKSGILKDASEKGDRISAYHLPVELAVATKCQYVSNYKMNEQPVIDFVNNHKFRYHFFWTSMINNARERFRDQNAIFGKNKSTNAVTSLTEKSNESFNTENQSTTSSFEEPNENHSSDLI